MTPAQLAHLLDRYDALLEAQGALPVRQDQDRESYHHLRWMVQEIRSFSDSSKAQRWIGFLQGVLWKSGLKSIEDLRCDVLSAKEIPHEPAKQI